MLQADLLRLMTITSSAAPFTTGLDNGVTSSRANSRLAWVGTSLRLKPYCRSRAKKLKTRLRLSSQEKAFRLAWHMGSLGTKVKLSHRPFAAELHRSALRTLAGWFHDSWNPRHRTRFHPRVLLSLRCELRGLLI